MPLKSTLTAGVLAAFLFWLPLATSTPFLFGDKGSHTDPRSWCYSLGRDDGSRHLAVRLYGTDGWLKACSTQEGRKGIADSIAGDGCGRVVEWHKEIDDFFCMFWVDSRTDKCVLRQIREYLKSDDLPPSVHSKAHVPDDCASHETPWKEMLPWVN